MKHVSLALLAMWLILATCTNRTDTSNQPASRVLGRQYYVSTRGSDSNPGTRELPFQTISKAARVAAAGDLVLIHAGIYYEEVKPSNSGEQDKYITYQNYGDGEVVIDAQGGKRPAGIEIVNRSYLQFVGLTVRGANSYESWPRAGICNSVPSS